MQENGFENVVWKMAAILSRPQCVNQIRTKQNKNHQHNSCVVVYIIPYRKAPPIQILLQILYYLVYFKGTYKRCSVGIYDWILGLIAIAVRTKSNIINIICSKYGALATGGKKLTLAALNLLHFSPLSLSGWRGIVVACVCPSIRLPVSSAWVGGSWGLLRWWSPSTMHPGILSAGIENGVTDLDLQGHFCHFDSENSRQFGLSAQ